ncbi:MAG: type II toxin-antitoxin system RelE/ParE family toxin [Mesorhizobium sp.]|nr:type II toxin-antitoxin system RelE/ParE family toxin [Mesorhizobium sp.]MCO5159586.1 type II toxin-antitoxin system RelE/ParE family toxin [Mesorhizobium sp.]
MSEFRLSKRADRHLRDIFLYGIESFGRRQADKYRAELDGCFAMLARHPRIGRTSPTIRAGMRRHEHGSHVILYREEADGVLIVAVLHARQVRGLKL